MHRIRNCKRSNMTRWPVLQASLRGRPGEPPTVVLPVVGIDDALAAQLRWTALAIVLAIVIVVTSISAGLVASA